ncbi:MAG TPA: hypothetical protein VMH86_05240 [Rhizomicrobium sp.]|nr:hypothetical protein [Rhizomicrobium sp.]
MKNFLIGSPLSRRDKAARYEALVAVNAGYLRACGSKTAADIERCAKTLALEREDHKIDRITDKSLGLMQVLALLLACVALKTPASEGLTEIVIAAALTAILLLLWNMLLVSPRHPDALQIDADIWNAMDINGARALRLTAAIVLTAGAIVLWFWALYLCAPS